MFTTRLNPTKPPAAHRAVLERVGAACRELRPIEESCCLERRPNGQIGLIFAKHNALGFGIAPEFGGLGTEPLLCAMAAERIGREGAGPCRFFVCHTALGAATLNRWGTPDQKARYLSRAARAECILGFVPPDEPDGHRPAAPGMTFEVSSTGFVLNGHNSSVENAGAGGALLTFAQDRNDGRISAFIVDASTPGLRAVLLEGKMGLPTFGQYEVWFQDCAVPRANLLGERGQGLSLVAFARLNGWLSVAAGSIGIIADCLEELVAGLNQKDSLQGATAGKWVEQNIAQMATRLEATRALVYAAAELKAEYDCHSTSKHLELEARTLVCAAAWFASESAHQVACWGNDAFGKQGLPPAPRVARHLSDTRTVVHKMSLEMFERNIADYYISQ